MIVIEVKHGVVIDVLCDSDQEVIVYDHDVIAAGDSPPELPASFRGSLDTPPPDFASIL